jgi:tripartite-type tricarboxylate transporter receptor subunit TctC
MKFAAAGLLFVVSTFAYAQQSTGGYPARPVRFVVPFAPGGGGDIVSRILAPKLSEFLAQPVVVENRGGAGGTLGTEIGAKAAPDGHTIVLGNVGPLAVAPSLYERLNYDPLKDLAPITLIASFPNLLVTHRSIPVQSVKDLVALAKAKPGQLNYASAGSGTSTHLAAELLKVVARIDVVHVPYKGGAQALTDLLAGQVAFYFASVPSAIAFVRNGKLRGLAVTSLARSSAAPDLPTIAEQGYPGFETAAWYGVLVPAGTPKDIIVRLHTELVRVLGQPDVKQKLQAQGGDPVGNSPGQFAAYIAAELAKWSKVIKAAGLKAD